MSYAFGSLVSPDRSGGGSDFHDPTDAEMAAYIEGSGFYDLDTALAWHWTDGLPQGFVDGVAGAGDTLSFGLTGYIRRQWNIDGAVDYHSAAYGHGEMAGLGIGMGTGAGLFTGSVRFGGTVTVTRWGGSGQWYMVGKRSTSSWWLSGTRFRYPYNSATTMQVPASQLSYPRGWERVKGLWGQRILRQ